MKDTRDKILDVAEEYIQKVGLNAMSYKHISEAVGIRKASIHHHFPKKENLVEELLTRCHTTYGGTYRDIVEGGGTAPEKLRRIAGVFREGLEKRQLCLVGMFGSDLNTLQAGSCRILDETIRSTVGIFAVAFRQGLEEGSLALPGDGPPPEELNRHKTPRCHHPHSTRWLGRALQTSRHRSLSRSGSSTACLDASSRAPESGGHLSRIGLAAPQMGTDSENDAALG